MKCKDFYLICFLYSVVVCCCGLESTFNELKTTTSAETQEEAVYSLIKRIIPQDVDKFNIHIDPLFGPEDKDTFKLEKLENNTVKITATTGVAASTGLHLYLKYYCHCHISWEAVNLVVPDILPPVSITVTSNDRFRYYQNVCTTSYSFVWWNWKQWEKHIDWMVLNSFNLVLAFNGQEEIWRRIYNKLNLTDAEIDEHFAGPAFLSWSRMGNIRGWGGPLSAAWHLRSVTLQHQILARMRSFGITPVLPAFAGHVPRAFRRLYPNAKMVKTGTWNDFNDTYCCPYLLDPTDPLFKTIGNMFTTELISEFGTDHAYSCDTFNEMQPASGNTTYIYEIGKSVYAAIESVDSKAVWVMQNWLFVHDFLFWTEPRAEALLTSVPKGRMIVLDLQSEQHPQYQRLKSYYGQPYIWCMLHNFGGTLGMFGSVEIINEEIFKARKEVNSTLVGTGITPEGINQNYVVYDLMSEMGWRQEPANLTEWFSQYVQRRYGQKEPSAVLAWQILKNTVYNFKGLTQMRGKYAINRRPSSRIQTWIWYDSCDLLQSWDYLLQAAKNLRGSNAYLHDVVDTTRQVLQVLGDQYYNEIINNFRKKDVSSFWDSSHLFLELLQDMNEILKSNEAFLLGVWLNSAKAAATNSDDEKLYEYNARNQITLWGPRGEIVDYANKQWSGITVMNYRIWFGIVSDFFLPRWLLFLNNMNTSLINNTTFKESVVVKKIFKEVEEPFTFDRTAFPDVPSGDTIQIAQRIHEKWWARGHCRFTRSQATPYDSFDQQGLLIMHRQQELNPNIYVVT